MFIFVIQVKVQPRQLKPPCQARVNPLMELNERNCGEKMLSAHLCLPTHLAWQSGISRCLSNKNHSVKIFSMCCQINYPSVDKYDKLLGEPEGRVCCLSVSFTWKSWCFTMFTLSISQAPVRLLVSQSSYYSDPMLSLYITGLWNVCKTLKLRNKQFRL